MSSTPTADAKLSAAHSQFAAAAMDAQSDIASLVLPWQSNPSKSSMIPLRNTFSAGGSEAAQALWKSHANLVNALDQASFHAESDRST